MFIIRIQEYEELNFTYTHKIQCSSRDFIEEIQKNQDKFNSDILIIVDSEQAEIYYNDNRKKDLKNINVWPAKKVRIESNISEFKSKLQELDTVLDSNRIENQKRYCIIKLIRFDDNFLIMDVYLKTKERVL
ncbi:DUF5975 family protein [Pseudobutyrivibrio xylanivorans]|uniref:DUF5975 family protein n=1 Tax=Pseudobutyrivibrio xylanivorans TaxID=185007 RepID=UPI000B7CBCBA